MIKENLTKIIEDINEIKIKNNIKRNIKLMAVSKTKPIEAILEALDAGQLLFGENRILEAYDKFTDKRIINENFELHIIGHLQRNKAKKACEISSMIQSIDKIDTLDTIDKSCKILNKKIDFLIEINTTDESQKFGINKNNYNNFLEDLFKKKYTNCNLRGLMTVGPFTNNKLEIRKCFKLLRKIYENIKKQINKNDFDVISMGMSNDYKIAIEEGSSLLRVGSSIFGTRNYKK